MALTKLTEDLNIISALDNEPNDVTGLTAEQLKAKFDEAGNLIKTYINDTLTPEADASFATRAEVQDVVLGQIPNGSLTQTKLDATLSTKIDRAIQPEGMVDNNVSVSPDVATALGLTGNAVVAEALAKLSGAAFRFPLFKHLSELDNGTEFTLNETKSGVTTPATFIKIKDNYEGSGRVLVLRKDAITPVKWNAAGTNDYSGSTIDTYLNTTYTGYLDSGIQSQLANVNIPYTIGNGNWSVATLARKCFALSLTEYGLSTSDVNIEGSATYAANVKVAQNNVHHYTRTPSKTLTNAAQIVTTSGGAAPYNVTNDIGVRPAFTLPSNFKAFDDSANAITDAFGNNFPLPYAKIATGSYTGTGTNGVASQNNLTFEFSPRLVMVARNTGYLVEGNTHAWQDCMIWFLGVTKQKVAGTTVGNSGQNTISTTTNGISWYSTEDATVQLNKSGYVYYYIAIG